MHFHRIVLFLFAISCAPVYAASTANPQVEFQTNLGSFVVELYPEKAPKTVAHFLKFVSNNYYQGTVFHRTVDKFMVQGGGFAAGPENLHVDCRLYRAWNEGSGRAAANQ